MACPSRRSVINSLKKVNRILVIFFVAPDANRPIWDDPIDIRAVFVVFFPLQRDATVRLRRGKRKVVERPAVAIVVVYVVVTDVFMCVFGLSP